MANQLIPRLNTGIPRLDFLLKGGFFEGGLYIVQGSPGMGKTILANQCCYHTAQKQQNAVYVSMLSETTGRMIGYLSELSFVNHDLIGNKVHYVSGYQILKDKKIPGLAEFVRKLIKEYKAKILIIDGMDVIESVADNTNEYREFIHAMQSFNSLSKCTTLLLMPPTDPKKQNVLEHALSDGVIDLREWRVGARAVREIQILKFRGSDYLKGGHEIEITKDGFHIHPRTEVQFGRPNEGNYAEDRSRMAFGIKNLDLMLNGGLLSGSLTTFFGTPGTGKTSMGISFLAEGAMRGEHGIYFGFYETPPRLLEKADHIGVPLRKYVENGTVEIQWQASVENFADGLAERLLERIREKKKDRIRVFIDGMSGFRRAMAYQDRFGSFLAALSNELRFLKATTLFSEESEFFSSDPELPNRELGSVVDNVIFLRNFELESKIRRLISILKVRESAYSAEVREFFITSKGVQVESETIKAESALTGKARNVRGK